MCVDASVQCMPAMHAHTCLRLPRHTHTLSCLLSGFRDFVIRGNVVDLSVAIVVGASFTALINSIVRVNHGQLICRLL